MYLKCIPEGNESHAQRRVSRTLNCLKNVVAGGYLRRFLESAVIFFGLRYKE